MWVYPPEILPLKIRAKGAALAAAADFLGNFLVVEITPPALKNIGYKTYIIFAVLNVANAIIVWCFYPETGGIPLEAVDRIFVDTETIDKHGTNMLRRLQWDVVPKANIYRREIRQGKRSMSFAAEQGSDKGIKGGTAYLDDRSS